MLTTLLELIKQDCHLIDIQIDAVDAINIWERKTVLLIVGASLREGVVIFGIRTFN